MDLAELLARFKNIGSGENLQPETSLQTQAPADPLAVDPNPAVPATSDLITPQGDPNSPPLPGQPMSPLASAIPLPQTSDTITPQPSPGTEATDPSLFDRVSGKLAAKQADGSVGGHADAANQLASMRASISGSRSPDSDYESEETPAPGAEAAPKGTDGYQLGSKDNLEKAQRSARFKKMFGGISDAGADLLNNGNAAMSLFTTKPIGNTFTKSAGDTLRASGDQDIKDQKDLVANQANDPKSQASAEMRDLARQLGFPVSDNVSAADIDKKFPGMSNIYSAKEAGKARAATAAENNKSREAIARENRESRADMMKFSLKTRQMDKADKYNDGEAKAMGDDLDPDKARGGNMAANQKQVYQADRLTQLYTEANGDLRNLDSRQMEELAIGINKLLSGSSTGASAQINALVPKSAVGNAAKLSEWLTNDPHGTDQLKFVQRMSETVDRERQIAQQQVKNAQIQRLSKHGKFREADPERYNSILQGYGIDPSEIDEKGQYKNPAKKGAKAPETAPAASDSVKMLAPDGTTRMVPKNQVDAALANGGKLAE